VEKTIIYYHRAYRKITGSVWKFLLELMCITVPLLLLFLFVYPLITRGICFIAHDILSGYLPQGAVQIYNQAFLLAGYPLLIYPGKILQVSQP
jgi:phosphotransferase system  glucose/maltose/N-acetylglucosamine-specific IIC component